MFDNISLGILNWKSIDVLVKTLDNYKEHDLFSLFGQNLIYFNSISNLDIEIANKYNLEYAGTNENLGIFYGTNALVENLKNDYILLLQNDNPIANSSNIVDIINESLNLLQNKKCDIIRLRHRWNVGEKFQHVRKYLKFYNPREIDKRFIENQHEGGVENKLLNNKLIKFLRRNIRFLKSKNISGGSIYIEKEPEKLFPKFIQKDGNFFIADSFVMNYTDQPILMSKSFYLYLSEYAKKHHSNRTINGLQCIEIILNCRWWQKKHFKIGIHDEGIFTHKRL
ncbi:MAG: hypothetical protein LBC92_02750 [Rickettsiales bacterium]|jgi:hypothetical protein|nr:hypothetical protein [Rickettsiales bacterium]